MNVYSLKSKYPIPKTHSVGEWLNHGALARTSIDQELSSLSEVARTYRERRNAFAPVGCLPIEVFQRILVQYAQSSGRRHSRSTQRRLMRTTWICRFWRSVALGCPEYWSSLPLDNTSWLSTAVERSGHTLLSSWVRPQCVLDFKELRNQVHQILPRLESLCVCSSGHLDLDKFLQITDAPAPRLTSLSFEKHYRHPLPNNIFLGQTPQLRHLDLGDCAWKWDSPLLRSGLTHLSLSGFVDPLEDDVWDALERMPFLQVLHLGITNDRRENANHNYVNPPASHRTLTLPHLRELSLSADTFVCCLFLSKLSAPSMVNIQLACQYRRLRDGFPQKATRWGVENYAVGPEFDSILSWIEGARRRNHVCKGTPNPGVADPSTTDADEHQSTQSRPSAACTCFNFWPPSPVHDCTTFHTRLTMESQLDFPRIDMNHLSGKMLLCSPFSEAQTLSIDGCRAEQAKVHVDLHDTEDLRVSRRCGLVDSRRSKRPYQVERP
ncbi:hypothetical protein NLI96_g941 [Meripilus lineatus]|uniref:F-box domain-containing protein n=1 Tax=Meripilus lineatus TaxID=2056292 RepID=A0AAD5YNA0_9APHY|nr:hypothetical protein NLI96_g941 [Physisporinus lineatus]